jgi:hypothetical protein
LNRRDDVGADAVLGMAVQKFASVWVATREVQEVDSGEDGKEAG